MIPRCTHWLGHKFQGRYSEEAFAAPPWSHYGVRSMSEYTYIELSEMARPKRTYERDICVRCGHVIERVK